MEGQHHLFDLRHTVLEFHCRFNISLPEIMAMPYKLVKCRYQMSNTDQPTHPEVKWEKAHTLCKLCLAIFDWP